MKNLKKRYHCVYDLNYHLILVTKYRRNVITDAISNGVTLDVLKRYIQSQGEKSDNKNH